MALTTVQQALVDAAFPECRSDMAAYLEKATDVVIAAELSVMGLARAKSHRSRLDSWGCEAPHIVGVEPRGAPRGRGHVGIGEAQDYLTATVLGPVKPSVNLCGDVLEGLGIRSVTKGSRKAVSLLADLVEQAIRPVSGASCKDR